MGMCTIKIVGWMTNCTLKSHHLNDTVYASLNAKVLPLFHSLTVLKLSRKKGLCSAKADLKSTAVLLAVHTSRIARAALARCPASLLAPHPALGSISTSRCTAWHE
jgi:hypothetical protein